MDPAVLACRIRSNRPLAAAAGFMGKIPPPYNHNHSHLNPSLNKSNPRPNLFPNNNANPLQFHRNQHRVPAARQNGDERRNRTAFDDAASSLSRKPMGLFSADSESGLCGYVIFDISTVSRSELRVLKSRWLGELEQVRSLADRIDAGDFQVRGVVKNNVAREKKLSGVKRPMPFSPGRKESKRAASSPPAVPDAVPPRSTVVEMEIPAVVGSADVMKMCKQMLTKLMRQKYSWVFNKPVDVEGLKLHDYYAIVDKPMDLGTVKSKLSRNLYTSPDEFGVDVRLTFNNAMLYNPVGQEVHSYAKELLGKFEELFVPICKIFEVEKRQQRSQIVMPHQSDKGNQPQLHPQPQRHTRPQWGQGSRGNNHFEEKHANVEKLDSEEAVVVVKDEVRGSSWSRMGSPVMPSAKQHERVVETRLEQPPPRPAPVPAPALASAPTEPGMPLGRPASAKLPKPKAKDPNKREMTMEEKHRLGLGLQGLPDEKMAVVIQIVRKRNGYLNQDGDEIELDIEAVDAETLWELDRFLTNYKKAVSKIKRQALLPIKNVAHKAPVGEKVLKKAGEVGEEDVDIGDEMPVSHFPPVEIEKDDDGRAASGSSNSSSSSSSGSSSSDSDSGSSSDSDSNIEDALSWDNGSKNFHNS